MKLTYECMKMINYIAICTAEATGDENEIYGREYNNDVELYFTIDYENNICHILYIESKYENNGNATAVINDFIKEFSDYTIVVDAIYYLENWYKSFGFIYDYDIDEMMCYHMSLRR